MAGPALSRRSTYFRYDVFINFRGKDTRHRFTGYLYHFLCKKGIRTFIDSEKLQFGEKITPSLLMAIKDSRIAITVFSENYASSSFCLDELVHILDWIKGEDRFVLPVFYHVDPSDLRYHRGAWGEALDKHEERLKNDDGMERLNKWKMALQAAAGMNGTHLTKHG